MSDAFAELDLIADGEGDGIAWLMMRIPSPWPRDIFSRM